MYSPEELGALADVVLESVGSPVFAASFRALAKGGRFVFAGSNAGEHRFEEING